jgi:hypothetical protein
MRELTPFIQARPVLISQCNDQRMDPVDFTSRRIHRADCKYKNQRRCVTWRLRRPGFMYNYCRSPFSVQNSLRVVLLPVRVLICQTCLVLSSVCWLDLGHIAAKPGLAR